MISIRRAALHDLPGAYRVCLLTGDAGRDGRALYQDPDLLGHVYVGPYIVGQPGVGLVPVDEQGVAGYVLAALDTRAFEAWAEAEWWPALRDPIPAARRGDAGRPSWCASSTPRRVPPTRWWRRSRRTSTSTWCERARGQGLGRSLVETLLADLRDARACPASTWTSGRGQRRMPSASTGTWASTKVQPLPDSRCSWGSGSSDAIDRTVATGLPGAHRLSSAKPPRDRPSEPGEEDERPVSRQIMTSDEVRRALVRIGHEIVEKHGGTDDLALVGIERRGVPLAHRIAEVIEANEGVRLPVGSLDITFYRDDLTLVDRQPRLKGTSLPFDPRRDDHRRRR